MREVDFLPTWYKEKRRYQARIWNQCVVLAVIFLIMIIWNSLATRSIVQASAKLTAGETRRLYAEHTSQQFDDYQACITSLQRQLACIETLDSHIDVPCVLAELSHVIGEQIVLSYMRVVAEPFCQTVFAEWPSDLETTTLPDVINPPLGDVRFHIILGGMAVNATEVAALIHNLEQSPYFRHVILVFARDADVSSGTEQRYKQPQSMTQQHRARQTEFEISCYLANYLEPAVERQS